jgi:hypothetical protein
MRLTAPPQKSASGLAFPSFSCNKSISCSSSSREERDLEFEGDYQNYERIFFVVESFSQIQASITQIQGH